MRVQLFSVGVNHWTSYTDNLFIVVRAGVELVIPFG